MTKDTSAHSSVNPLQTSVHIVRHLKKITAQNEEMAVASCNKHAGTRLGTTEAAAGGERLKTGCPDCHSSYDSCEGPWTISPSSVTLLNQALPLKVSFQIFKSK